MLVFIGLFQNGHMLYHLEEGSKEQPTLAEMTEVAINVLSKQKEGFYLFVEGGRIDQGHHDTWARRALDETVEFQKAVKVRFLVIVLYRIPQLRRG